MKNPAKVPPKYKAVIDPDTGRVKLVERTDPRLDASAKIRQRSSKKQKPVRTVGR
jgi:hypothetical protein